MATPTYDLLDSTTLSASASSVTFTSIDQSYRDLVLVIDVINADSGNKAVFCQLNGDTGSNYPYVRMAGNGTSTSSFVVSTDFHLNLSNTNDSTTSIGIAHFMDYSATDKHKTVLSRQNRVGLVSAKAHRYANTDAITSMLFFLNSGDIASGSTLSLYGIAS